MTIARLLAALLGAAPHDEPMTRLLALDDEAFTQRVCLPYPADGADTTGRCVRDSARVGVNA
ncbi:hypothetical protein [Streptomyces flaveolus]|uniref:hypothetical protein n=1 Tax=Streptomyces flaveolus TaxID=67297 RepID=UPI0036FA7AB8